MKISIVLFFISAFYFSSVKAQENTELLFLKKKGEISLADQKKELKDQRAFAFSYNPFKFLGNSFLWVYQKVFSEQINAGCGFSPSCSSFAKEALKQRGFFMGVLLSADRLTRCNGAAQIESEIYLVDKKTGKLQDDPEMYKLSK